MTAINEPKDSLNSLMRGIANHDTQLTRDAWRDLIEIGPAAVPVVLEKLHATTWAKHARGPQTRYFAALLGLLLAMDKAAAHAEMTRLSNSKTHPLHRQTLKLAMAQLEDTPAEYRVRGIPLVISNDLPQPEKIRTLISKWMGQVPVNDLENLTRIDVVPYQPQFDYGGRYNIYFSGVILVWPALSEDDFFPLPWLNLLLTEQTFYHEIGHHAHGHLKFGQVKTQEDQAKEYALKMSMRAHPIFALLRHPYNLWRRGRKFIRSRRPENKEPHK